MAVKAWTFDDRDRMEAIAHYESNGGALITSFEYLHPTNAIGEPHRITQTDSTGAKSYIDLTYDDALRVHREEYYDGDPNDAITDVLVRTISYTYDAAGNRTSVTEDFVTEEYVIDPISGFKLTATGGLDGVVGTGGDDASYGYDDGGRLTDIIRNGNDWDLTYNASGQVTSVNRVGASNLGYQYDALGRRTQATNGANTTNFLIAPAAQRLGAGALDVEQQHLATDGTGQLLQGWIYAGENPILRYDDLGNVEYYLESANDSIAALVNSGANIVAEYEFDAFGNSLNGVQPTSAAGGDFGFHAAWRDNETGLYHVRARTYDPETGRFLSVDPAEPNEQIPESYHPYSFANNNPHLYSDPTGLFSITEINVSGAISNTIKGGRQAAINQTRRFLIDKAQELAVDFLVESLTGFLPGMSLLAGVERFTNGLAQGRAFDNLIKGGIAEAFEGLPFAQNIWFDAQVQATGAGRGRARTNGFNATEEGVRELNNTTFGRTLPRPDFIYREGQPTDKNRKSWLIGDFKLSINAIYDNIVVRRKNQWKAIAAHAARESHGRVAVYIALRGHKNEAVQASQVAKITKAAIGKGVVMLIVNILD